MTTPLYRRCTCCSGLTALEPLPSWGEVVAHACRTCDGVSPPRFTRSPKISRESS